MPHTKMFLSVSFFSGPKIKKCHNFIFLWDHTTGFLWTHIKIMFLSVSFLVDPCKKVSFPLSSLHDKYFIVPADKASNNIVFVCKSYYFEPQIIHDLFKHSLW